jgi:transmembrane sensor
MSEIDEMDCVLSPAEAIDAEAVAWFVDRDESPERPPELMKDARASFEAWLAESPKHLMAYWRVEAGWDHAGLLTAVRPPRDLRDGTGIHRMASARREWKFWFGRLGAIAAVLVIGVTTAFQFIGRQTVTYSTPVGGNETIALADGSRIELNTDTTLRVSSIRQDREVELVRGEAFFDVKHDPSHPLVVSVGGERVVDLGTAFVVRKDEQFTKIGLVEGSVRLESSGFWLHSPLATLMPGDVAVTAADRIAITKGAARELADGLAWRTGKLIFRRATLGEAAAEFNRYNAQKLVVADAATADLRFSSVFPVHGIEAFARVAQKALGLHVERQGGDIVIMR